MSDRELNVILKATTSQFTSGTKEAEEAVKGLTEKIGGAGESIASKFEGLSSVFSGGGVESALSGITGSLGSIVESSGEALAALGPVGIGIAGVAAAAVAAVAVFGAFALAVKEIVEPQIEAIEANERLAKSLNMPIESLEAFQQEAHELNVPIESVNTALQHLSQQLGEAAVKGGEPKKVLDALGVSISDLSRRDIGTIITQRLSEITDANTRAYYAEQLFGRGAKEIMPIILEGADGLDQASKKAKEYGESVNGIQAGQVTAAADAWKDVGMRLDGIEKQLTVALAPAIEMIGKLVLDIIPDIADFKSAFEDAIVGVASAIDRIIDAWNNLKAIMSLGSEGYFGSESDIAGDITQKFQDAAGPVTDAAADLGVSAAEAFNKGYGSVGPPAIDTTSPEVKEAQGWVDEAQANLKNVTASAIANSNQNDLSPEAVAARQSVQSANSAYADALKNPYLPEDDKVRNGSPDAFAGSDQGRYIKEAIIAFQKAKADRDAAIAAYDKAHADQNKNIAQYSPEIQAAQQQLKGAQMAQDAVNARNTTGGKGFNQALGDADFQKFLHSDAAKALGLTDESDIKKIYDAEHPAANKDGTPGTPIGSEALQKMIDALKAVEQYKSQDKAAEAAAKAQTDAAKKAAEAKTEADKKAAEGAKKDHDKANEEALRAWNKTQEETNQIIKDSETPLQKYQDKLKELQDLYNNPASHLSKDQYELAKDKAAAEYYRSVNKDDKKPDERFNSTDRRGDVWTQAGQNTDVPMQQLAEAQKQTMLQNQIFQALSPSTGTTNNTVDIDSLA